MTGKSRLHVHRFACKLMTCNLHDSRCRRHPLSCQEVVEGEMADDNDSNSSAEGKKEMKDTKETQRAQALQVPHAVLPVNPDQKPDTAEREPSLKRQAEVDNHAEEPAKKRREKKSKESPAVQGEPGKASVKESLETQASPQGQSTVADNQSIAAAGPVESAGGSKRQRDPKLQPSPQLEQPAEPAEPADAKRRRQDQQKQTEQDQKAAQLALAAKAQDLLDAKRERIQERILLRQLGAGERRAKENPSPDATSKQQQITSGAVVQDGASSYQKAGRVAADVQEPRRIAFEVKSHQEAKKADRTSSVATEQTANMQKQIAQPLQAELLVEPVLKAAQDTLLIPVGLK